MIRICVLGNSHAATLKHGWVTISPNYPEFQIIFFAGGGTSMSNLVLEGNRLVPKSTELEKAIARSSNGRKTVEIDDFDAFILYGLRFHPFIPIHERYSAGCLNRAMAGTLEQSILWGLARMIRSVSDKAILVGHRPLIAGGTVQSRGYEDLYLRGQKQLSEIFFYPSRLSLVLQPSDTIVNGKNTDPVFLEGAKRFHPGKRNDRTRMPEGDRLHMNEKFGKKMLSSFLAEILSAERE
jgi:hypothetical protein